MSTQRRKLRDRALALAFGALISAGAGVALWKLRPESRAVPVFDNTLELQAEWISRRLAPRGLRLPEGTPRIAEDFRRRSLSPEEVMRGLGLKHSKDMEYDAHRLFRFSANLCEVIPSPELPGGQWIRVTNGYGAREDRDLPDRLPRPFVLVAGDSHTEGMCNNADTYCSLLEPALAAALSGPVEVYNTGTSGYTLYNYLGVLEDFAARKPDVFVTTIFGGNDFLELLRVHHLFAGTVPPPRPYDYWRRLQAAEAIAPAALPQGLSQLLLLRDHPEELELALRVADHALGEIQALCAAGGIDWIAVYLPAVIDMRPPEWAETTAKLEEILHLGRDDFQITNRLGDRCLALIAAHGATTIDLRPLFAKETEPLYLNDMHINLRGQRVVADALRPRIEELLRAREARAR